MFTWVEMRRNQIRKEPRNWLAFERSRVHTLCVTMKMVWGILKIVACMWGGVVLASVLFVASVALIVGGHDGNEQERITEIWLPWSWVIGAICGAVVFSHLDALLRFDIGRRIEDLKKRLNKNG